jgi:hypothetical protein
MNLSHFFALSLAATALVYGSGCTTVVEDCTDPTARNFNAEADKDCCCTFYQLQWSMRHFANDSSEIMQLEVPFTDPQGQILTPSALNFMISEVELIDSFGVAWAVQDSIYPFLRDGSSAYLKNSFAILNPNGLIYKFGKFARRGNYVALRFRLGLSATAAQVDGQRVSPATLPLSATASPTLYDSTAGQYNHYRLILNNVNADTTYILTSQLDTVIELAMPIAVVDGSDTNINIDVYYSLLLASVAWGIDSPATIAAKIFQNAPLAFRVRP